MSYTHSPITGAYRFTGRAARRLSLDEIKQLDEIGETVAALEAGTVANGSITNTKLAADVKVGSLAALETTANTNAVAAINEIKGVADEAAADAAVALPAATAAATAAVSALATANAASAATAGIGTLSTLNTTAKTTAVAAINEVNGKAVAAYNNNGLLETNGTEKGCLVNGITLIAGGAGIENLTLAAPTAGARAVIRLVSIDSNSVIVTCANGVTVDGENDIMTFDAANEMIDLVYKSATEWAIVQNVGGVGLSATSA